MNDGAHTDAELLAATARGDDEAFTVLVRRRDVCPATLLAAQLLGYRKDAEHILQDAFAVVYQKAGSFDTQRPFAPGLFGIVRRMAANRRSGELRPERLLRLFARGTVAEPASASAQPDDVLLAQLDVATVTHAMLDL